MEKEFITSLVTLFERDLNKLGTEIGMYEDEMDLWVIKGEIKNSAGNLCLHLCGNLQHFIGAILGNSGYQRDRDFEFSAKGIPKSELVDLVQQTKKAVLETLNNMSVTSLDKNYPIEVFGKPMTTLHFLIHLEGHLNYHLGQVNYHRRLITSF